MRTHRPRRVSRGAAGGARGGGGSAPRADERDGRRGSGRVPVNSAWWCRMTGELVFGGTEGAMGSGACGRGEERRGLRGGGERGGGEQEQPSECSRGRDGAGRSGLGDCLVCVRASRERSWSGPAYTEGMQQRGGAQGCTPPPRGRLPSLDHTCPLSLSLRTAVLSYCSCDTSSHPTAPLCPPVPKLPPRGPPTLRSTVPFVLDAASCCRPHAGPASHGCSWITQHVRESGQESAAGQTAASRPARTHRLEARRS